MSVLKGPKEEIKSKQNIQWQGFEWMSVLKGPKEEMKSKSGTMHVNLESFECFTQDWSHLYRNENFSFSLYSKLKQYLYSTFYLSHQDDQKYFVT